MADKVEQKSDSAEKAYAEAAAGVKPAKQPSRIEAEVSKASLAKANVDAKSEPTAAAAPVKKSAPAKKAPVKKAAAKKPAAAKAKAAPKKAVAKKAVAKKPATKKVAAKKVAAPKKAAVKKAPAKAAAPKTKSTPVTKLKETIMATTKKTEAAAKPLANAYEEVQTRAKAAYEKGTELAGEATEFTKGNVEAVVESGKIFAAGVQDMGRVYADDAKTAFETVTKDMKDMAAVKSPTELFQLQGELLRRNVDKAIELSSRNTEMTIKLVNEAFAPISSRVSVAQEKFSKAA